MRRSPKPGTGGLIKFQVKDMDGVNDWLAAAGLPILLSLGDKAFG